VMGGVRGAGVRRSGEAGGREAEGLFDDVDFVTNDKLRSVLAKTSATPRQVEEAVAINERARLRALRGSFLIVAAISLLAIFPAARLPKYVPDQLSADDIVNETGRERQGSQSVVDSGSDRQS